MPVRKSESVILRVTPYLEYDALLTVYAFDYGRVSLIAKGGFSKRSKLKPYLQIATIAELAFYQQENRQIQPIKEIHLSYVYQKVSIDPCLFAMASAFVEIFQQAVQEEELPDLELFTFLKTALISLDQTDYPFQLWLDFHLQLLDFIGYGSQVHEPESPYSSNFKQSFIQQAQDIYQVYAEHIDTFSTPKAFQVLLQLL